MVKKKNNKNLERGLNIVRNLPAIACFTPHP